MFLYFSSLSLFGFLIFLIWVIIALNTNSKKSISTIGLVLLAFILVTGVSKPTSATDDNSINSINEYKIILADNSDNYELENVIDSNSGELTNYSISKEKGLGIVTSKVKIETNLQVLYDSEREINESTYYVYTLNTDEYTLEDYAYFVDANSGKLFKCSIDMVLSPIE